MNISVKEITSVDKEVTLKANREELQPKFDKALKKYQGQINLPGFRPGKVPLGIIRKRFGSEIEIEEINKLPEMQGIKIYEMNNQAEGILSSLRELMNSGILGAVLSVVVLFFFLRQFGTTMVVATAVPFSLIVTLGFFYFLGITLNILSMMGLMLASVSLQSLPPYWSESCPSISWS